MRKRTTNGTNTQSLGFLVHCKATRAYEHISCACSMSLDIGTHWSNLKLTSRWSVVTDLRA